MMELYQILLLISIIFSAISAIANACLIVSTYKKMKWSSHKGNDKRDKTNNRAYNTGNGSDNG